MGAEEFNSYAQSYNENQYNSLILYLIVWWLIKLLVCFKKSYCLIFSIKNQYDMFNKRLCVQVRVQ